MDPRPDEGSSVFLTGSSSDDRPVLPGRLDRLASELRDEGVPALDGAPDEMAALVELAYALRPDVHENRVPSYGALVPPSPLTIEDQGRTDNAQVRLIPVGDLDLRLARRFADGATTFAVRSADSVSHLACFGRNMADEYDLVGLQTSMGGLIVQRHQEGQVRVFGPAGVVRWDGIRWHHDPPLADWVRRLATVTGDLSLQGIEPILRFAIHELGGRRVGATLIWRPTDERPPDRRVEPLVHNVPALRLVDVGEAAAIAQALSNTDGAAIFDASATLVAMGIRLVPSPLAEQQIGSMGGMRHTSALRYSHDDPDAVVIVVSESGPVTLMYRGQVLTSVDPRDATIG